MDKMRPPGVNAISLNPLTDQLLNFDSTYLLDVASIIGRSLVQRLGLRSKPSAIESDGGSSPPFNSPEGRPRGTW